MEVPMTLHSLPGRDWLLAFGIGIVTGLFLSAVMVPAFILGIAPMPEPPSLAFAKTLLGPRVPLPVGLLFHVAYVTGWAVAFVVLFRRRLSFRNALWLGLALWLVALLVFFPIIGWGPLGLAIGPKLIVASLVPHLLFSLFLWALCRVAFGRTAAAGDAPAG